VFDKLLPALLLVSAVLTALVVVLASRGWVRLFRRRTSRPLPPGSKRSHGSFLDGTFMRRLAPLAQRLRPQDEGELAGLRLRLAQAGYSSREAVDMYARLQVASLAAGVALAVPWLFLEEPGLILIGLAASAMVGVLLPRFWLSVRTSNRREGIQHALASTLDLLVTCMEAGLGLEQALDRVGQELAHSEPQMSDELAITINEMRAGIPVAQAFRKLAQRVNLEEMHMLCGVIIQSASLGASIGSMLRQYAASWRTQRMLDLEEKAGKMTASLTLPLTLCLLPSAILAMLGPAVIVVMRNLA